VRICPNCGEENPERFRLCGFCGAELAARIAPQEVRKTVSIVFSDLQGSTKLGEALDSEALREVMLRYFDVMREALEHHGGVVEKYIGDAVMAVFGLPRVHEDDALRAVRAAAAMQEGLAELNDELDRRWGVRLINRTGVNTGEVVAGDAAEGQRLVSGDTTNVAARLEQAAPPLEVLIGEPTYRLVRDAVEVEQVEPLELKGKSERVPAYRLIRVSGSDGVARRHDRPLVGRERELALLEAELSVAEAGRSARLTTVVGSAGVGKSRLVEELAGRAATEVRFLRGRCLPYGRGITFWPVVEAVRDAAGIRDDDQPATALARLAALAEGAEEGVVERVAAAVGLSDAQFPVQDLFWGVRKLLETLARERTLLFVFEDVHWAEATLLDLVEHLAGPTTNVPLLIVCTGRPDILERETEHGAVIDLRPLSDAESGLVIENLLGDAGFPADAQHRIVEAAEGNPLFVEQMLGMLIDDGMLREVDGRWVCEGDLAALAIPPSINALLEARLDLLTPEERAVVEPAAVIGHVFAHEALESLVDENVRPQLDTCLSTLVAKQLVRPEPSADGERHLRFEHILIRDAAYQGLLKRARATLHERFVDWAEVVNRERDRETEYEEILGYHLEQANRFLSELAPLDDHGRDLGSRGARYLTSAGRRAFARTDMSAAANLLRRAATLLPANDRTRLELLPALGEALMETGEFAWAELFLDEAVAGAAVLGDSRLEADAALTRLLVHHHTTEDLGDWRAEVQREAERAIPTLEALDAHAELAKAWQLLGFVHGSVLRYGEAANAVQQAAEHARLAGDTRQEARNASAYLFAALNGPTPVEEVVDRCEGLLTQGLANRQAEALVLRSLAHLCAMRGDFARGRELYTRARELLNDLGLSVFAASISIQASSVEMLASDPAAAERELQRDTETLSGLGEKYLLPVLTGLLAQSVQAQGRSAEAAEISRIAEELAAEDDVEAQAVWRAVRAKVLAEAGEYEDAERLAREAVELLRETEATVKLADTLLDLAEVLISAGQVRAGQAALEESSRLHEAKGNLVAHSRAQALLDELPFASSL
jgi:class 3 adenylate cyclase/tetratricopeptide (TPR) repeat protein